MRVCQPGPVAFQRASVSGGRRSEIARRALSDFGRPRGFNSRVAAASPTISGSLSRAGRARSKVALVHSGFSRVVLVALGLRFISPHLTPISLSQADHMHRSASWCEHHCMQTPRYEPERLESPFAIFLPKILGDQRSVPLKLLCDLERNTAAGDIPFVFCRIEADIGHLLYIR